MYRFKKSTSLRYFPGMIAIKSIHGIKRLIAALRIKNKTVKHTFHFSPVCLLKPEQEIILTMENQLYQFKNCKFLKWVSTMILTRGSNLFSLQSNPILLISKSDMFKQMCMWSILANPSSNIKFSFHFTGPLVATYLIIQRNTFIFALKLKEFLDSNDQYFPEYVYIHHEGV